MKIIIPLLLIIIGLATIIYPRITGVPLTPAFKYENLAQYSFWAIPFIYIASYATRAWGPLLFAFMLGGAISAFVKRETMIKHMQSRKIKSYFIAALSAPILTVCSCAMIPIFGGIMMAGAGIGPALTFLLMAPAANILALIFTTEIISWKIALARFVFSFIGAIIIGLIVSRTPWAKKVEEKFSKIKKMNIKEKDGNYISEKFWKSLNTAWFLTKTVVPYLVLGLVIVSFIEAYLSPEIVARWLTGSLGVMLAAVIGVPTYTPTLVEVFLVKGLINLGMSPAAALAFLIGAPMASIPSMLGVSRIIGWKTVLSYAVLAIITAMIAGFFYMFFIVTL